MFNELATRHYPVFGNSSASNPGWPLEQYLFAPGDQGRNAQSFISHLVDDLGAKRFTGNLTVTFCGMWGRAVRTCRLSLELLLNHFRIAGISFIPGDPARFIRIERHSGQPCCVADVFFRNQLVSMVGLRAFRIEKFANMPLGRPGRTTPCPFPWCGDQCELPECPRSRIWRKQDVISEDRRLRAIPFRVSTPYPSIPRVATHDSIIFGS